MFRDPDKDIHTTVAFEKMERFDEVLLLGSDSRSYIKGETCSVFSAEQITESFGVRVFQGRIGNGRFFLPVGEYSKNVKNLGQDPK